MVRWTVLAAVAGLAGCAGDDGYGSGYGPYHGPTQGYGYGPGYYRSPYHSVRPYYPSYGYGGGGQGFTLIANFPQGTVP
jgi:hypothetical protein